MASTPPQFYCYVDEAGDDGFQFDRGSSDWFVLAGIILQAAEENTTVKAINGIRQEIAKRSHTFNPKRPLHWRDLNHDQKVFCAQQLARYPFRAVTVCVFKPAVESGIFQGRDEPYLLYRYATRFLLERVSWLAREGSPAGTCHLVFSNMAAMSYRLMRDYLRLLRTMSESGQDVRIAWEYLDIDAIETTPPGKRAGLQVADAFAGAIYNALERNAYGNTESRYVAELQGRFWRGGPYRKVLGYGMKLWPSGVQVEREIASLPGLEWFQK